MKLIIVSGLSGSGKSVALHTLEDEGFHCIDNLPVGLLKAFTHSLVDQEPAVYDKAAVGIDARSGPEELRQFTGLLQQIRESGLEVDVLFLQADVDTLLKRFSETRRKHPLTRRGIPLVEAIHLERSLLSDVASNADLFIDTSQTTLHQLRTMVRDRLGAGAAPGMSLLVQSFGFKHGVPSDSDFVFDTRCLPNPYWYQNLRSLTGMDTDVREFLDRSPLVEKMFTDIRGYLDAWIPCFDAENRRYMSVSIGCTGGQHRSVYLVERLGAHFRSRKGLNVSLRHRELEQSGHWE